MVNGKNLEDWRIKFIYKKLNWWNIYGLFGALKTRLEASTGGN
jgi:hypothetical protein